MLALFPPTPTFLLFFPIFLCCTMRMYLNEELWGLLWKMTVCSTVSSCSSRDALLTCMECLSPARKQKSAGFGMQHHWHSKPEGCVGCQQDAGLSAVSRIVLAFWGKWNLCHVFLCPDVAEDLSQRLGKSSWFLSVTINSSSYILMHTHRYFMWLAAEGNTCHSSWTQSSQSSEGIQGWRSMLGLGKKVLDPSERFSLVIHALVLTSQPVSAAWKYLEADFPSAIWAAFYTWKCVQVSHQELGTHGTCAWSAAQPSALFLISACWISFYMGLSQSGASVMLRLFFVSHSVAVGLCCFAFLGLCLSLRWLWPDQCLDSVRCFWRQSCGCLLPDMGFLN